MPVPDDVLAELAKQGIDLGDGGDKVKPLTIQNKINIYQDYAKVLADTRGGGPQAMAAALSFLENNPELSSALYSNYDIAAPEGMEKFSKAMLDLERMGALGTNLGGKASSLSQSVTTRTLSPSEAESIFNLELKFQQLTKQAPLEAAKFLAPGYVPESFAGSNMPGFEEGGIYRKLLPGMNPDMFKYQPTDPNAVNTIAKMFQPDENEAMQMARMAMENALRTGISSTSTTNTTSSGGGGGAATPPNMNALMSAYFGSGTGTPYQPFAQQAPGSFGPPIPPGMGAPDPMSMMPSLGQQAQQSMNPLQQAWTAATGPTNPIAQLFQRLGVR